MENKSWRHPQSSWDFLEVNAEFPEPWTRLSRQLGSLHHWKYSKLGWIFSSVSCSSWFCFGQGQGWCDLRRWFLTSTTLWNHEQVPHPTALSMHSRDSWSLPPCSTMSNLFLGFIHNLLFLPHTNILSYAYSHTLHSSIQVNLQYPKPNSLGLFLGPLLPPRPPSANFVQ